MWVRQSLLGFLILSAVPASAEITIENLQDGETVSYELLIIRGGITTTADSVVVLNNHSDNDAMVWPTNNGLYKCAVLLKRGKNVISLGANDESEKNITIYWNPITANQNENFVRMTYALPSDHETLDYGLFQAPVFEDNSVESAVKRLRTAGLMMQAAVADLFQRSGREKKTFRLERDNQGEVKVTVHVSDWDFSEMTSSNSGQPLLARIAGREMDDYPDAINATILLTSSVTRFLGGDVFPEGNCWNDCDHIQAGEAWGGEEGGWVHSANLFTWSEEVSQIPARFSDVRDPKDYDLYPARSYRSLFWGAYGWTLGSILHEMGHTWDLSHNNGDCGIMNSYHENINRLFMASEPEEGGAQPYENGEVEICYESFVFNQIEDLENFGLPEEWDPTPVIPFAYKDKPYSALILDARDNLRHYNLKGQKRVRQNRWQAGIKIPGN